VTEENAARFTWPVRVYYEDTDRAGVVYYANYLKFMERARTEWLRSLGLEQDTMSVELGIIFAVRSAYVDYLRPARFNQLLSVSVEVIETGRASLTFNQEVIASNISSTTIKTTKHTTEGEREVVTSGEVICRGQIKIACLDMNSMKPCVIPDPVREEILSVC